MNPMGPPFEILDRIQRFLGFQNMSCKCEIRCSFDLDGTYVMMLEIIPRNRVVGIRCITKIMPKLVNDIEIAGMINKTTNEFEGFIRRAIQEGKL